MFHTPKSSILQKLIVCYWIIETDHIPMNTKMMPDGYSDIMLNLGDAYTVIDTYGAKIPVRGSAVFGQRTNFLKLQQSGFVNMIGIRLKPGSEGLFFNDPAELVDTHVLLNDLFHADVIAAENEIRELDDAAQKIDRVEKLLLDQLQQQNKPEVELKIDAVLNKLLSPFTAFDKLEGTLGKAGLSYKQAERLFKANLGLTPKQYFRVVRFHKAFTQMRGKEELDWMTILQQNGYYDQAHFIKDFRYFTGQSPTQQKGLKDTLDDFFRL